MTQAEIETITAAAIAAAAGAITGYGRCINPDGSVTLTAFHDGGRTDVLIPAPPAAAP